jgi:acyl dehydratase
MEACESFTFLPEDMRAFSAVARDMAPIHWDTAFARQRGYSDILVFGFLVAARFSGILGNRLPGPHTVLHSVRFQMAQPVYVGETILYRVTVRQIAAAVRSVVLDLVASRASGEVVLRGQAQCGFGG